MPLSNDTYEIRLDYDVRTDDQAVYMGTASTGTDVDDAYWTLSKYTYDGSNRLTRVQYLTGSWTSRTTYAWT